MSKRDEPSDVDEADDFYDLPSEDEDAQDSRFSKLGTKRRKLHRPDASDDEDPSDEEAPGEDDHLAQSYQDDEPTEDTLSKVAASSKSSPSTKRTSKPKETGLLSQRQLEKAQRKARRSGVIYLSRIPPFMKVHTLKSLLSPYGTLGRVFLTPEAPARYQARVKAGGNKKRSFVDGWVEFTSKRQARVCAETLNGNIVGGKKGGWYHDDIWNVKYLRGFKWNDLMEQVQGEEREREGRLRAEIQRDTRERKAFLDNVERAKVERGMEAKRARKDEGGEGGEAGDVGGADAMDTSMALADGLQRKKGKMRFRQNAVSRKDPEQAVPASAISKLF